MISRFLDASLAGERHPINVRSLKKTPEKEKLSVWQGIPT